jgi:AbrB family looped-hinge helix DNA binding protein
MVKDMSDATITMDKAGRLLLPKALRDRFRLRPGSQLEILVRGDHFELRPLELTPALVKVDGWWVHQGVPDRGESLRCAVERHRAERHGDLWR